MKPHVSSRELWRPKNFDLTGLFSAFGPVRVLLSELCGGLWTWGTSSVDFNEAEFVDSTPLSTRVFALPLKSSRVVPESKLGL